MMMMTMMMLVLLIGARNGADGAADGCFGIYCVVGERKRKRGKDIIQLSAGHAWQSFALEIRARARLEPREQTIHDLTSTNMTFIIMSR